MNGKKLFFLIFFMPAIIHGEGQVNQIISPNIHMPASIKIENNANLSLNAVADIKNEITAFFQQFHVVETIVKWKQHITDTVSAVKERALGFFEQSKDLVVDHKFKIIGTSILGLCVFFLYRIYRANIYLANENLWSAWEYSVTMEELLAMPKQELTNKLMIEIQKRYVNVDDPADFLTPMICFMKDVEQELKILNRYNRLYNWSIKIRLNNILPFNKHLFAQIQEKIQRLLYVKNGFASWVAQYKMLNALKKSETVRRSRKIDLLELNQGSTAST